MIGTLQNLRLVLPVTGCEKTSVHLPAPEFCGNFVETAGPRDQILHAAGGKERATGLQTLHADIFRISHDASLAELGSLLRFCAQSDGADASYRCKRAAPLLDALCLVEICDALLGHYVTHVVAVNHDRSDRHTRLPTDFDCIQGLDKRRHSTLFKGLYSLNDYFSSSRGRAQICF